MAEDLKVRLSFKPIPSFYLIRRELFVFDPKLMT